MRRELADPARHRQQPGDAGHHQRAASRGVGADTGKARSHGLQRHIAETFRLAGKKENIRRGIGGGQFLAVQRAAEDRVWQRASARAFRPIADNQSLVRNAHGAELAQGLRQDVGALFAHQP